MKYPINTLSLRKYQGSKLTIVQLHAYHIIFD